MTDAEWLSSDDPGEMLASMHELVSGRKLRLLTVAYCRGAGSAFAEYGAELEAVERFADGLLTPAEFDAVLQGVHPLMGTFMSAHRLLEAATSAELWRSACEGASKAGVAAESQDRSLWHYRDCRFSAHIRDIFGNPFRPVAFSPEWRTDTAVSLAKQRYESQDFGAMPILADALQDAGCDSGEVLDHCRGPGPHVRGCWVVDLVLGKE